MASGAPVDDCDRAASKQQADILKEWARELARALNFAIDTEPVLVELAKKRCGPAWTKEGGAEGIEEVAEHLESARIIHDMQKMALSRDGVKPTSKGIPQGWSGVVESKEENVKDEFKISMLVASLVKATQDETGVAKMKEQDAKDVAKLVWEKREQTLPGKGVVEPKRPDSPASDC